MGQNQLHAYVDFISPYAYLGWVAARRLVASRGDLTLVAHPVLFAGFLSHWGQKGPAEIAPKRAFTFKDAVRRAFDLGVPLELPASHPFNPLTPLRLSLAEVAGADQHAIIDACFAAVWAERVDVSDPAAVSAYLVRRGFDGDALVARTQEPGVKTALQAATQAAVDRGVFGVPTWVIGEEHFFGHDRLTDAVRYLDGADPVTAAHVEGIARLPASARRKQ